LKTCISEELDCEAEISLNGKTTTLFHIA